MLQSLLQKFMGFTTLTMLSSAVQFFKFSFQFIYPIFRSARIARGKEPDEHKLRLLKFWVIYSLMHLIVYYTETILEMLEVTDIALTCVYLFLILNNFQGAEWAYDNLITEGFSRHEKRLHEFFKTLRQVFENSVYKGLSAVRDIFFAFLAGLLPKLPGPILFVLTYTGIEKMLNDALDNVNKFDSKKKKDEEYKMKQREIE